MNNRSFAAFTLLLILQLSSTVVSQDVSVQYYTSSDYKRSPLFLEQDLIYDRRKIYSQGLELICLQDKVKAEIQNYGTIYTPVDLDNVSPGDYRIKLSKTGYYPFMITVTVKPGERSSVQVNLKPYLTGLTINGLPVDSLIYINNEKIDGNFIEISPGEVSLRIRAFGYKDFFEVIEITGDENQSFTPELVPEAFSLTDLKANHETVYLKDSPSQKVLNFTVLATAPGEGLYRFVRLSDSALVEEGLFNIVSEKTVLTFDLRDFTKSDEGEYRLEIEASDGELEEEENKTVSVAGGMKSRWRNSFTGPSGFLYCPDTMTLPGGVNQIQIGLNPAFTGISIDDLFIPSFLTLRAGITDRLELTAGTALYITPQVDQSALDLYVSGKMMILENKGKQGFALSASLSANYNGKTGELSSISPFDPYSGVSGLSLALPFQYRIGGFSITMAPEFRISPSYPMTEPGGFTDGEAYIWNYFKGAVSWDRGIMTIALSAALQSPSYLQGGEDWPFYGGGEISLTPGKTGFSFSLFGGFRYLYGDPLMGTAGITAGFLW